MPETEAQFQSYVTDLLAVYGWKLLYEDAPFRCHKCHAYQKPRKVAGHPDLEIVRGNRLVYLELKSQKGRIQPAQEETLDALKKVTNTSASLVRPSNRGWIEEMLR